MVRFALFFFSVAFVACSPLSKKNLTRTFEGGEQKFQNHTGFIIYDPSNKKTLYEYQSDRYFTPASNTKILTLYAAFNILGDSIPALRYVEKKDSLIFWGTGDPSFLNPISFSNQRVIEFLAASRQPLYYSSSNFYTTHFGPGWGWDDYNDDYSQERSPFPIYGNSFSVLPLPDRFLIIPKFFERFYQKGSPRERAEIIRDPAFNNFVYYPGVKGKFKEFLIPFHTGPDLVADLLMDTLHQPVRPIKRAIDYSAKTLYSIPADSVYKVMMQQSDNHIAEQLLLMCSGVLSDSLKPEIAIRHMKQKYFYDMNDQPVWRDGSGLSRYNLFTPRFIVAVWDKLYKEVPRERLFPLLAEGGKSGTLKNWYKANEPYIFGKTGTLSNNHSLSGYLVTKRGKVLIFSFMNANYTIPLNEVRQNMQRVLNLYYENY